MLAVIERYCARVKCDDAIGWAWCDVVSLSLSLVRRARAMTRNERAIFPGVLSILSLVSVVCVRYPSPRRPYTVVGTTGYSAYLQYVTVDR